MSWLARITLDFPMASRLRLFDNYAWHKAAWEVFPHRDGEPRRFLSRLDVRPDGFDLLLLSREAPDRPTWCTEDFFAVKPIPSRFLEYRAYRFDLRANPTRKVTKFGKDGNPTKNGRRLALMREEEQMAWLGRKAQEGGFRLFPSQPVVIDPAVSHLFRIPRLKRFGLHLGVRFRGVLEVSDQHRFYETFHRGIGSAKAFGFGMLVLKPVQLAHSSEKEFP